ncbi:hypothetical protein ES706_00045 [subsurface metagenome]
MYKALIIQPFFKQLSDFLNRGHFFNKATFSVNLIRKEMRVRIQNPFYMSFNSIHNLCF